MFSPGVESHCWVSGILSQIQEGCSSQLLFNDKSLLQQLETSGQEFVLDLKEISFSNIHLGN